MASEAQSQQGMDLTKKGGKWKQIIICEPVKKKEKAAEEGGTRRGRIQLEPSRTSGLCLSITRNPCDKTHAFNDLCDNQALLKTVKRRVGEGGKATFVGAPDADILLLGSNRRAPKKNNSRSSDVSDQSESTSRKTCK